jgi:pimeloyl-ACP methyl ester carboxylesterase
MRKIRMIFILFIMLGLVLDGCGKSKKPFRFEEADCMFQVPYNTKIECGNLNVPEDRSQPGSPMIQIHVAVVKSKSKQPLSDPVIVLQGGPGGSALDAMQYWLDIFDPVLKNRDLIVFDQRGVGYSQPALNCQEMDEQFYQYQAMDISLEEELQLDAQAAKACHDRLVEEGIKLNAYTSASNAEDVNDLRLALGYKQWNLYGSSYGTRLALTVMRDFPEGVRSVLIDSVYPPRVDIYAEIGMNAERSFNLLFKRCSENSRCAEAFPDLQDVFYEVVNRLDERPITINLKLPDNNEILMNGRRLVSAVFNSLYSTVDIPTLPKVIYELFDGRTEELINLLSKNMFLPEFFYEGMGNSVECGEEAPFTSLQAIEHGNATVNPHIREALAWTPTLTTCAFWETNAVQTIENDPVVSDIPTLIFVGGFDPITPPAWGKLAAETLSNAQFIEFPNFGHGVLGEGMDGGNCSQKIYDSFLSDPLTKVDQSCIANLSFFFITR